jgi:hypothetical protein
VILSSQKSGHKIYRQNGKNEVTIRAIRQFITTTHSATHKERIISQVQKQPSVALQS